MALPAPASVSAPLDTTAKPSPEAEKRTRTEPPPLPPRRQPARLLALDPEYVRIETAKFSMTIAQNAQITSYILKEYVFQGRIASLSARPLRQTNFTAPAILTLILVS